MSNIIKLLPDAVANQIAAGEVIQRPASAVKELLENAVDSGAAHVSLMIKDAGKTLVQVNDDGCGMATLDARMSFERHATSKISKAADLFAIHTFGFRGEALASVAAIAQVDMKTRQHDDELGTCLRVEGSKLTAQETCQCKAGTSISVRNLFYNVPARRNFLKSNTTETRHVIEEFMRVALINSHINFEITSNAKLVYKLTPGSFKKRIVDLFGKVYDERLLPVNQKTELITIKGFILKAEFSRKTRGEQYFFVNKRFIRHAYLNHAVTKAYNELLPTDAYPSYFLHIETNPSDIDINIHPTKTEVNFKDARYVYSVLHAAVRESIGKHSLTPTLDFDEDPSLTEAFTTLPRQDLQAPSVKINPDYNPFKTNDRATDRGFEHKHDMGDKNWETLYRQDEKISMAFPTGNDKENTFASSENTSVEKENPNRFFQIHRRYIACNVRSGVMLIDQQRAHERILYEEYLERLAGRHQPSQQQLFPQQLHFSPDDATLLKDLKEALSQLGFSIEELGKQSVIVNGIPADLQDTDIKATLEKIVEDAKRCNNNPGNDKNIQLARSMAAQLSVKPGTTLSETEMADLFDRLFACKVPETAPEGKKIVGILKLTVLEGFLR